MDLLVFGIFIDCRCGKAEHRFCYESEFEDETSEVATRGFRLLRLATIVLTIVAGFSICLYLLMVFGGGGMNRDGLAGNEGQMVRRSINELSAQARNPSAAPATTSMTRCCSTKNADTATPAAAIQAHTIHERGTTPRIARQHSTGSVAWKAGNLFAGGSKSNDSKAANVLPENVSGQLA